jgi:hypothetical protein
MRRHGLGEYSFGKQQLAGGFGLPGIVFIRRREDAFMSSLKPIRFQLDQSMHHPEV